MKYKFVGNLSDVSTLTKLGYFDNVWGRDHDPIKVVDGMFDASKSFYSQDGGVAVAISYYKGNTSIDIYKYRGTPSMHKRICIARNRKQYIQDLLEKGLVEII